MVFSSLGQNGTAPAASSNSVLRLRLAAWFTDDVANVGALRCSVFSSAEHDELAVSEAALVANGSATMAASLFREVPPLKGSCVG